MITVRGYIESDYEDIKELYMDGSTYGGQYDEARDTAQKLSLLSQSNPCKVLVAIKEKELVGTLTLFEDGRTAFLYRFSAKKMFEQEICDALYTTGINILKELGHTQVMVLCPTGNTLLSERYKTLGLNKGSDYTVFRKDI